jgi:hypothetical protein
MERDVFEVPDSSLILKEIGDFYLNRFRKSSIPINRKMNFGYAKKLFDEAYNLFSNEIDDDKTIDRVPKSGFEREFAIICFYLGRIYLEVKKVETSAFYLDRAAKYGYKKVNQID